MTWLEVSKDIYSIKEKIEKLWHPSTNIYFLLCDTHGGHLYDAGYAIRASFNQFLTDFRDLYKNLKKEGKLAPNAQFSNVVYKIILSHDHHDHASGAPLLKRVFPNAKIVATKSTMRLLADSSSQNGTGEAGLGVSNGFLQNLLMKVFYRFMNVPDAIEVDEIVRDGDYLSCDKQKIKCVCDGGHAPGQLLLYQEEDQILLSSDLILANISTWLGPPHSDYVSYKRFMNRLLSMPISTILPAHGRIIQNPKERIQELIRFRRLREKQIIECCSKKPRTVRYITRMIYSERGIRTLFIAQGMVELVTNYLVSKGELRVIEKKGKRVFVKI